MPPVADLLTKIRQTEQDTRRQAAEQLRTILLRPAGPEPGDEDALVNAAKTLGLNLESLPDLADDLQRLERYKATLARTDTIMEQGKRVAVARAEAEKWRDAELVRVQRDYEAKLVDLLPASNKYNDEHTAMREANQWHNTLQRKWDSIVTGQPD